jgi:amino acid transporter
MAEVAVDERRLLKTIRWYDGFVIGLANPGFLIVGLGFSIGALGVEVAAILWFVSALIGALQAYIYAEPAAMFPDKPGGLSVYAREGWRKYFSLAGPIAVFGYWFAWSSVLAVYGGLIGILLVTEFPDLAASWEPWEIPVLGWDVWVYRLIGFVAIFACWFFNIRGMRPAVWFSYVTGACMAAPVIVMAVGPFITGDWNSFPTTSGPESNVVGDTLVGFFAEDPSGINEFGLVMVWMYIIGWSTYGPEAPATFAPEFIDTKNDTRKAIASTGALNVFLAALLPIAVAGTVGYAVILGDVTGIAYLVTVLHDIVGETVGTLLVIGFCGGLLLSMNTATMDGSRALYALAREKMTIKQLAHLNSHHVPNRAMTLDLFLNVFMLFAFPTIFFIIASGNLGYMLSHVLALTGFLLLRKDRPAWPRPFRLGPVWVVLAAVFAVLNAVFIFFGVWHLEWTGYLWDVAYTNSTYYFNEAIIVGVLALVTGIAGYVIAQRQHGKPFRWTDPSDEQPSPEVYELMGTSAPSPAAGD